tara:strand:+ start:20 stop:352 length:333 start_codon:yes stop_codon:yes gene_type:complete
MFNFFKKKKEENVLCHVKYYMVDQGLKLDIKMEDYSEESLSCLANILNSLYNNGLFFDTLSIIDYYFNEEGEIDNLFKLYEKLDEKILRDKLSSNVGEKESPCIKPSDMI